MSEPFSDQIIELLRGLAAFNLLTEHIVLLIGNAFKVEAKEMCKAHGITYWVPPRVLCPDCKCLYVEKSAHVCPKVD